MRAAEGEYTPTPAVSHAILARNRDRDAGLADGMVITPSHNPPEEGGLKYNPPNGGPAAEEITKRIEARANELLHGGERTIHRVAAERALRAPTTHRHDYLTAYVNDLVNAIDMECIRGSRIHVGIDPLGGAGVNYWPAIADRYGLDLTVVNDDVDPTFRFMPVDWDGRIRMDPSSPYAMQRLIALKDRFDVAAACDPDHDRHGIVARTTGLLPPNHYLTVAVHYLFRNRPGWSSMAAVGKTVVSSRTIDLVTRKLGRTLYEVPVGFKWFVDGLLAGTLGFAGEESAGASFLRFDGTAWTTDKDGIVPALLAAEITARVGRDPGEIYRELAREFGEPVYERVDAAATAEQKQKLSRLSPEQVRSAELAGEKIHATIARAPGNGAPIGGLKISSRSGWFAARPSGLGATILIASVLGPRAPSGTKQQPQPGRGAQPDDRNNGGPLRAAGAHTDLHGFGGRVLVRRPRRHWHPGVSLHAGRGIGGRRLRGTDDKIRARAHVAVCRHHHHHIVACLHFRGQRQARQKTASRVSADFRQVERLQRAAELHFQRRALREFVTPHRQIAADADLFRREGDGAVLVRERGKSAPGQQGQGQQCTSHTFSSFS